MNSFQRKHWELDINSIKTEQNEIIKGMKVFKKPLPIDICEAYAKIGKEEILYDYVIRKNSSDRLEFNDKQRKEQQQRPIDDNQQKVFLGYH